MEREYTFVVKKDKKGVYRFKALFGTRDNYKKIKEKVALQNIQHAREKNKMLEDAGEPVENKEQYWYYIL